MAKINLQKIVNVKGKQGLFHLNAYNPKGYHLQPLGGGPVIFIANERDKVLALGNVDFKLTEGTINLMDIFIKMDENPPQNVLDLKSYFHSIVPELDAAIPESQLRKVVSWFSLIKDEYEIKEMVNEEDDGLMIT